MAELFNKKQIKREHFENIVAIAFIDGLLDKEEKQFLAEKSKRLF